MKKITRRQWERDVSNGILHRGGKRKKPKYENSIDSTSTSRLEINSWIVNKVGKGLNITIKKKRNIILLLPEVMNFYDEFETTSLHIAAIRKLTEYNVVPRKCYRLQSVNFDGLRKISTSAALVLTAELSKWDSNIRQRLRPMVDNWDKAILTQFTDIGFFDLFNNKPELIESGEKITDFNIVKYIKGTCGDGKKTRELRSELLKIIGSKIGKWTFLRSGLDEAITNVSHHAYPSDYGYSKIDKKWYLTGSYDSKTRKVKIVFYDQGIGIPKSLPASKTWEKVLQYLSSYDVADRKKDEVLLKAAVEIDRTSTSKSDRGKGLQDLLVFIRQRKEGYLAIMSSKGLYKCTINGDNEQHKTEHFTNPINGTLIIWSATL